ncbi:MAG: hypothetical protein AAF204_00545, partial [Pseudomonadota bacterium]
SIPAPLRRAISSETGERTYLTDPKQISELNRQAYVEGRMFRNETGHSQDPENGWLKTLKANLKAKDIISDTQETHNKIHEEMDAVDREIDEVVQKKQSHSVPNLNAEFSSSSTNHRHEPGPRSEIAATYNTAATDHDHHSHDHGAEHSQPETPDKTLTSQMST